MKFSEIPQFIERGSYEINIDLKSLDTQIAEWETYSPNGLQLNPDFQRGHVWSMAQQVEFVEFFLRGGVTGRVLYFNKPSWQLEIEPGAYDDFVIVDGLQRLTALRLFMQGKIKAFGLFLNQFQGRLSSCPASRNLKINVNTLKTKKEVLEWYLQMNTGGVVHTSEEIDRVKAMLFRERRLTGSFT